MSVATPRVSQASPGPDPNPLIVQTHDKIIAVLRKKGGTTKEQSTAIKAILEEAFQDAAEAEEAYSLQITYVEELTRSNAELLLQIKEIADEHAILKKKTEDIENQKLVELQKEIEALEEKNLSAEKLYSELKLKSGELKAQGGDLEQKYRDLAGQFDALSTENAELKKKSGSLEDESKELARKYQALDKETEKYKKDSEELLGKCGKLESEYKDLKEETTSWVTRYDELNKDYGKLQQVVDNALQAQKRAPKAMQQKNPPDPFTDKFSACARIWTFVGQQMWDAMPLPVHLLYHYGKDFYEKRQK